MTQHLATEVDPARRDAERPVPLRHLMIVARDRPDLYDQFTRQFAHDPVVDVILDRRVRERRHRAELRLPNRREGDRRESAVYVQSALWLPGYVVVRSQ